uniref:Uncharacterized protein n=1 Tax=Thermosporothrix sp. COM3 TaxID=2490863 RepID=A0A455STA6_9CHLR|nr:hypothetical protein KTC_54690 [Thermosporothrix sp. COM3]
MKYRAADTDPAASATYRDCHARLKKHPVASFPPFTALYAVNDALVLLEIRGITSVFREYRFSYVYIDRNSDRTLIETGKLYSRTFHI